MSRSRLNLFALALALCLLGALTAAQSSSAAAKWGFHHTFNSYCLAAGGAYEYINSASTCPAGQSKIDIRQQMARVASSGAKTVRIYTAWQGIERKAPVKVAGQSVHTYDWSRTDERYFWAVAHGLKPVLLLATAPEWAAQKGAAAKCEKASCGFAPARTHIGDWRAFAEAAMTRYGDLTWAVEVWNEPNLYHFWFPRIQPGMYVEVLKAAHKARQAAGFQGPLLSGGLAAVNDNPGKAMTAAGFLQEIYSQGRKSWFEGIALHPYPGGAPWVKNMWAKIDPVQQVRDQNGDSKTGIWLTESGLRSSRDMARDAYAAKSVTENKQGKVIESLYNSLAKHREARVKAFFVYSLLELSEQGPYWQPFGLLRINLSPKPAYCYIRVHLGGKSGACA